MPRPGASTSAFDVTEHVDSFTIDGNGRSANDPAYDLALLRITAEGLVPAAWAEAADPPAGTLLAAAGTGELPLAVGVVSVRSWSRMR